MADRQNEGVVERETGALKKLQALAGVAERGRSERVDWMYEQSVAQKTELEAMNAPVGGAVDKDMADVKSLNNGTTSGSLFLKGSATRTTEDTLRKLREDPLFQIRREEQAARQSMMENPLVQARLKKKFAKVGKKDKKKAKKELKKEKKAMKKAKKLAKKVGKKGSSSSSSSSAGSADPAPAGVKRGGIPGSPPRRRSPEPEAKREKKEEIDLKSLGPSGEMVSKREERASRIAEGKAQALASRGLAGRLDEDEKRRRVEQMQVDAKTHDNIKTKKIAAAEAHDKETEDKEAKNRAHSDQKYFRDMREQAYMEENSSMSERLKNQRHRRQKGIVDTLEKDK